jgi:signal transduction histidine kinase
VRNYSELPPITCYIGQLTQVFTNIITNAADALVLQAVSQEYNRTIKRAKSDLQFLQPRLTITTQVLSSPTSDQENINERWVEIIIADNGLGLTPEAKENILESFSVEKRTAKETSLAVSYQIITAKHGGQIKIESRSIAEGYPPEETGTEFQIFLPLA